MVIDRRLGGITRFYLDQPKDWNMRVPDDVLKSVVFLARIVPKGSQEKVILVGTGFLVGISSETHPDVAHVYLVTAKHVAEVLILGDWAVRMNLKSGKKADFRATATHQWWFHPTESDTVDVAVTVFHFQEDIGVKVLPIEMLLKQEQLNTEIGPGDDVFITGLFNRVGAQSKNLPIVRTGNVSLMEDGARIPGIKVSGQCVDSEVYLVEARSIGGLSGSPAFVRTTLTLKAAFENKSSGESKTLEYQSPGPFYLLGLLHGHWDIPIEDKNDVDFRDVQVLGSKS